MMVHDVIFVPTCSPFMARALVFAVFLRGIVPAWCLNLTAADGGDSRLLRREGGAKLWEEMVQAATGEQVSPAFHPEVRQCNYRKAMAVQRSQRRSNTQRALKEVKDILGRHDVPVILMGGLARGYYKSCTASVGGMDRLVATFGPWLEEAGLQRLIGTFKQHGHRMDTEDCKAGPLHAGCKLSVHLFHTAPKPGPSLDIQVLFSAPPAAVARPPGRFSACASSCGKHCEHCGLAYAYYTEASRRQDRFFPCPMPLHSFVLTAWMNDTFWVPQDMEAYLEADEHVSKCSTETMSSFETMVILPKGSQVLQLQRRAEDKEMHRIAAAAAHDRRLWRSYFTQDTMSNTQSPWSFGHKPPALGFRVLDLFQIKYLLLGIGLALLLGAAYVVAKRLCVCSTRAVKAMGSSVYGGMFSIYMAILLAQTFSQHLANASGLFALAASILWQFAYLTWAAGAVWMSGGWKGLGSVVLPRPSVATLGLLSLTLLLGLCAAVSQWLSFIALSWLDPVSYLLFVQVSLLLAQIASSANRQFCREHVLALAIVVLAFLVKGVKAATEQDLVLYRGLVAVLIQVLLLAMVLLCKPIMQEALASREVLELAQSIQGTFFLLAIFRFYAGHWSALRENLNHVFNSQWVLISIALMLLARVVRSDCLPAASTPVEELGLCWLILKTAGLQWFILQWGGGDASDLQMIGLGVLALVVCFAEHLASHPLPDPPKQLPLKPALKKSPQPAPKTRSLAPPRPKAKPAPRGRKESDLSEVSTTAPSTPRGSTILPPPPRGLAAATSESSSSDFSSDWTSDTE